MFVFTGANYIIETTSVFTTIRKCQRHIQAGARKVIIAGQSADAPMLIMGVNEENYTRQETILSTGSCTTTCLAPFVKVVHDKFDIVEGSVTTVHSYTAMQKILDGSSKKVKNDRRKNALFMSSYVGLASWTRSCRKHYSIISWCGKSCKFIPRGKERTFRLEVHLSTKVCASGKKYGQVVRSSLKSIEVLKSWEKSNKVLESFKKCE